MFEWAVVGAGPAGIASIGQLLDAGISPRTIAWIDPAFKVGDFGTSWRYVGSNTAVGHFVKFYWQCRSFCYADAHASFFIGKLPPEKNCPLMVAAEPLQWVTQFLCKSVTTIQGVVNRLIPAEHGWQIDFDGREGIDARKIILAVGGEPQQLSFSNMPARAVLLKTALTPAELKAAITATDTIAVFGSAQSAKSVLDNLRSVEVKKILHFYRSENSFSRHLADTALEHVESIRASPHNLLAHMPSCTKIICAIGFKRRHIPIVGLPDDYEYDRKTGEIAPGVFGIGMAFPEIAPHELGQAEYRVTSIWPFMTRLRTLIPHWLDV